MSNESIDLLLDEIVGEFKTAPPVAVGLRQGTIHSIESGSVTVKIADSSIPVPAKYLTSYFPIVNDTVWLLHKGKFVLVIGSIGSTLVGSRLQTQEVTVSTGAISAITFSNIPQTFRNLRIACLVRGTGAGSVDTLLMRFNGNADPGYYSQQDYGDNATPRAFAATGETFMRIGFITSSSAAANAAAATNIRILGYRNATFHKQAISKSSATDGTLANHRSGTFGGRWASLAAVSSITLLPAVGQFAIGSEFHLYGE